ncbi:hypothetical protein [Winogradskyella sp. PE311]|uniref:hypothetical protein n=1 Tax=Winogradskyella sp. PE311 TaxID=3366943 RepID=UPI00397F21D7
MRLIVLLFILIIGFTSCEGRKTQRQALNEDIAEFKKNITIQKDVYQPETYTEHEVDTLLSNGYRIRIKTYSDMENTVLITKIIDTINYQNHYRQYKFDILIEKEGHSIFNESFDKSKINTLLGNNSKGIKNSLNKNFEKLAILKSIQLKDYISEDYVLIDLGYAIPEKDIIDWYTLKIDKYGNSSFITTKIN